MSSLSARRPRQLPLPFARYFGTSVPSLLLLFLSAAPLPAQIDYRNLDDDRPVVSEDAYPVERYAFELLAPYHFFYTVGAAAAPAPDKEYRYLTTDLLVRPPWVGHPRVCW